MIWDKTELKLIEVAFHYTNKTSKVQLNSYDVIKILLLVVAV